MCIARTGSYFEFRAKNRKEEESLWLVNLRGLLQPTKDAKEFLLLAWGGLCIHGGSNLTKIAALAAAIQKSQEKKFKLYFSITSIIQ